MITATTYMHACLEFAAKYMYMFTFRITTYGGNLIRLLKIHVWNNREQENRINAMRQMRQIIFTLDMFVVLWKVNEEQGNITIHFFYFT